jgi:hypothetical protein
MNRSFELLCNFPFSFGSCLYTDWCNALRSIHVPSQKNKLVDPHLTDATTTAGGGHHLLKPNASWQLHDGIGLQGRVHQLH